MRRDPLILMFSSPHTVKGEQPLTSFLRIAAVVPSLGCPQPGRVALPGQSKWRHPGIDRLVLTRFHQIGFVPDTDIASAVLHCLVKRRPGWPVFVVLTSRIG